MSADSEEKSCRHRCAEAPPCVGCKWCCHVCTAAFDGGCESMRTCCCCPCWVYFFYTAVLGGGATVYASLALLDDSIAADEEVQRGCQIVAASGAIHVLASIYIMVRLHRDMKEYGRMQDYMKGLDSTIIQETVIKEMWMVLARDWIFRIYALLSIGSYVQAIMFAGLGLVDVESTLPQNAVFCLMLHMCLSVSLICCWKSALMCGIFCESVASLLLPQSPPRRTLEAPVEITEEELSAPLAVKETPAQQSMPEVVVAPQEEAAEKRDAKEGGDAKEGAELWQKLQSEQRSKRDVEDKEGTELWGNLQSEQRAIRTSLEPGVANGGGP